MFEEVNVLEKFIKGDPSMIGADIDLKRKELYASLKDNLKKFSSGLSK